MAAKQIADGAYIISLGAVNVFLLESTDGLVLVDAGMPGHTEKILEGVRELGKKPGDINHILVTHWHPDHFGSLAEVQRATDAQTYAHPIDAPLIRKGGDLDPKADGPRKFTPAPTFITRLLFRLVLKPYAGVEGAEINHEIEAGETLPFLPNMQIIFAPGHSHGQIVFLWHDVLFAADTCANLPFLSWSIGYENFEEAKRTLKKLCDYDFQIATFGHGKPIMQGAAARWRKKWGNL